MATPAAFPYTVFNGATPGSGFDIVGHQDVLEFNSSVRHMVVPDFDALVLKAYISTDNGATWSLADTGPSISSNIVLISQVVCCTADQTNKIIYALFYSTSDTITVVPFNATLGGGTFGSPDDSGVGYDSGTTSNAVVSGAVLLGQYRASDTSIWTAFEAGSQAGILQRVRGMKYSVGVGWGSSSNLTPASSATQESSLGGIGLDTISNAIHITVFDYQVGSGDENIRHLSIDAFDSIAVPDVVEHVITGIIPFMSTLIGVDLSGNLMFSYTLTGGGANKLAYGTAGSWSVTTPAFIQDSAGHAFDPAQPCFFSGLWYLFYTDFQATQQDYYSVTSPDGSTWGSPAVYATLTSGDPLWGALIDALPVVFSSKIVQGFFLEPTSRISGEAYWEVGGSPPPPVVTGYVSGGSGGISWATPSAA